MHAARYALALTLALFALTALPSHAGAHFVDPYFVRDDIRNTNAGGECGRGPILCFADWTILQYLGGDGNPRVGSHSLQFEVTFRESYGGGVGARYRTCIQRWYHEQFGETYSCRTK